MAESAATWSEWLDQHGGTLVLLARRWTASQADAEDVVQEAFVRFWRTRTTVEEPLAYLYACVRTCALDWQRGSLRRRQREQINARPEVEPLLTSPLEFDERRQAIETALRGLPEDQATVLVMKIWGGLTFPQIASALNTSSNTAASRYRYALAKLREQLVVEAIL